MSALEKEELFWYDVRVSIEARLGESWTFGGEGTVKNISKDIRLELGRAMEQARCAQFEVTVHRHA